MQSNKLKDNGDNHGEDDTGLDLDHDSGDKEI